MKTSSILSSHGRFITPAPSLPLVAACLICFGCEPSSPTVPPKPVAPLAVQTTQPHRGPITRSVTLPGEIKPYQQATLYAKVAGYLKTIKIDTGDAVNQGDLLAQIEVPELEADRARYQAELKVADLDYRRLSESRTKAPDLVVPQTVDDALAKLEIAKANVERTETLLNYATISAPFPGIVTRRFVDPGAFIPAASAGSSAQNAALLTLADFSRVRLRVAVPESESALVALNQPVTASVEGLPGKVFEGKITRFAYALDDASKTMLAEIELPNPGLRLRPGMYATVKIGIEPKSDAFLVPAEAVLTEKAGASVFVLSDAKAKKTKVQTGFADGTNVEILKGLDPDQHLILPGKQALVDGQSVTVSDQK